MTAASLVTTSVATVAFFSAAVVFLAAAISNTNFGYYTQKSAKLSQICMPMNGAISYSL